MNICILNMGFKMGGVEKVSSLLANALCEKKHKVTLVDFTGENKFYYDTFEVINKPEAINPRNFKRKIIARVSRMKFRLNNKSLSVYKLFKEQVDDLIKFLEVTNFDILIMNQGVLSALVPYIKRKFPNIKIVAWQHNEYDKYLKVYNKYFIKDYLKGIEEADLVVCLTTSDEIKFKSLNHNSKFIYNPLTINNHKISNLSNKSIIFVGRLVMEQKGLDYLIEIGKELKAGWKIYIAGQGADKMKFERMIQENKLEDKIILKGPLSGQQLIDFYVSSSVFISTSRWEGFGLVITEAMACGVPVVAFENNGPKEILKNGEYGILVEKNNTKEFCSKLNSLITDPLKMKYFQSKSLERIKDFEMDSIVKDWEINLNNLIMK